MKLKIRITESQLEELREKYKMSKEKDRYDNNDHSLKKPYTKKGFIFIKLDSGKDLPKDCYYFTEEDASDLNQMGQDLEALKVAYDEKLKSLSGDKKKKDKE
jgi:hypothetical protein